MWTLGAVWLRRCAHAHTRSQSQFSLLMDTVWLNAGRVWAHQCPPTFALAHEMNTNQSLRCLPRILYHTKAKREKITFGIVPKEIHYFFSQLKPPGTFWEPNIWNDIFLIKLIGRRLNLCLALFSPLDSKSVPEGHILDNGHRVDLGTHRVLGKPEVSLYQ